MVLASYVFRELNDVICGKHLAHRRPSVSGDLSSPILHSYGKILKKLSK